MGMGYGNAIRMQENERLNGMKGNWWYVVAVLAVHCKTERRDTTARGFGPAICAM